MCEEGTITACGCESTYCGCRTIRCPDCIEIENNGLIEKALYRSALNKYKSEWAKEKVQPVWQSPHDCSLDTLILTGVQRGTHHLYIAKSKNHIKIGITKNLERRMAGIQTNNQYKIEVLYVFKGERKFCRALEITLHTWCQNYQAEGGTEWFRLEALAKVKEYLKSVPHVHIGEEE